MGCVAVVRAAEGAQLRWFLVAPGARGSGLGGELLAEALAFAAGEPGTPFLWTFAGLDAAAGLYRRAGFALAEERPPHAAWGPRAVVEQRYVLRRST